MQRHEHGGRIQKGLDAMENRGSADPNRVQA